MRRVKWKWTWAGDLETQALIPSQVHLIDWGTTQEPYLVAGLSSYGAATAIHLNEGALNNAGNNPSFGLPGVMEFFSAGVQYGMKIKMRLIPFQDNLAGNWQAFMGMRNYDDGLSDTDFYLKVREIPGWKVRMPSIGQNYQVAPTSNKELVMTKYFSLNQYNPRWKYDLEDYSGEIALGQWYTTPSKKGQQICIGICSKNGGTFATDVILFKAVIDVTHYILLWKPVYKATA